MASILADVLGAPVRYEPSIGIPRDIVSVFREDPLEAIDQDGHPVLIVSPTWRVQRHLVPEIAREDRIAPGNGRIYRVLNHDPSGSPAADAMLICELERILFP